MKIKIPQLRSVLTSGVVTTPCHHCSHSLHDQVGVEEDESLEGGGELSVVEWQHVEQVQRVLEGGHQGGAVLPLPR